MSLQLRGSSTVVNPAANVRSLPTGLVIAHRGSGLNAPEASMAAYKLAVAQGAKMIEMDLWATMDGVLYPMHDNTLDRTTTGTGHPSEITYATLRTLKIEGLALNGAPWADDVPIPTFAEIVQEFGNKVAMYVQVNTGGSYFTHVQTVQKAIDVLARYGVNPATVNMQVNETAAVTLAKSAGYFVSWGVLDDVAGAAAAGAHAMITQAVTQQMVTDAHAAGLKVQAGVFTRQADYARVSALGVDQIFCDDAVYVEGKYKSTSDRFSAQQRVPGFRGNDTTPVYGVFEAPDAWGMDLSGAATNVDCLGYLDLSSGNDGTIVIDAQVRIDTLNAADTTRGVYFYLGQSDKYWNAATVVGTDSCDGYLFFLRANGKGDIYCYDYTNDVQTTVALNASPGTAPTLGAWFGIKITVTPTTVTLARTDAGATTAVTRTDSTVRGLTKLHVGRAGAGFRVKDIVVS